MRYELEKWKNSKLGAVPRITALEEERIFPLGNMKQLPMKIQAAARGYELKDMLLWRDSLVYLQRGRVAAAVLLGEKEDELVVVHMYDAPWGKQGMAERLLRFSLEELDEFFPGSYKYISCIGNEITEKNLQRLMQKK